MEIFIKDENPDKYRKMLMDYITKSSGDRSSGIEKIYCPELLEEMRNYEPKGYNPMKEIYYVPKIEDIHVGYECQFCNEYDPTPVQSDNVTEKPENKGWWNMTIGIEHDLEEMSWSLSCEYPSTRTPYLNTEQIVKEGWKYLCEPDLSLLWGSVRFDKENYLLIKDFRDCKIRIFKERERKFKYEGGPTHDTLFEGICPSINEFRTICKLLKIK